MSQHMRGKSGKATINGTEMAITDWKVDPDSIGANPFRPTTAELAAWKESSPFTLDYDFDSYTPYPLGIRAVSLHHCPKDGDLSKFNGKDFGMLIEDIDRLMPSSGFVIVPASAFTAPPFKHLGIECDEYLIMRDGDKVAISPSTSSDFKMAKSLPADQLCVVLTAAGTLCMGRA